jgi:integrase
MARPPMPVGTFGMIGCVQLPTGRWRAKVKFREYSGQIKVVSRVGASRSTAERALRAHLRELTVADHTGPDTRLTAFAGLWLATVQESALSTGTKQTYEQALRTYVLPALGALQLREIGVPAIDRAIGAIGRRSGPGAARSAKKVLSLILAHAVRRGALTHNPVRDATPLPSKQKRARALTAGQADDISDKARADQWAVDHDLPDLIDWMLYTGCRIGEACAARPGVNTDGRQLLDLDAGTWEVNATIVRVRGQGLTIQERTKTDAGWRVLALPAGAVELVKRRRSELRLRTRAGVLFGSPGSRSLRDPSNTIRDLRIFLRSAGYDWVTSHTFRKTVATRLEEAGCTPRQVADQLGHAHPSMTMDVYFGRGVVTAAAATVLDR